MEAVTSVLMPLTADAAILPAAAVAQDGSRRPAEQQKHDAPGSPRPSVKNLVDSLNEAMRVINTSISFSIDKDTGKTVIKVMDSDTKKLIRQIPPEDMLRVAARIQDLVGVLYDEKR